MITIITNKINKLNKISYNQFLENIDFHQLTYSCDIGGF